MPVANSVMVGMAECHVGKGGLFTCLGLGSCIGLCGFDPVSKVGGMVHIMLPEKFADKPLEKAGKFADTGVPFLLDQLEAMGAVRSRIRWAMAGGAQVFMFGDQSSSRLDIGKRNGLAVQEAMRKLNLRSIAEEIGGHEGRTLVMCADTGIVRVRTVSKGERELCKLG